MTVMVRASSNLPDKLENESIRGIANESTAGIFLYSPKSRNRYRFQNSMFSSI
jgi:hypothetical protein